MNDKFPRLRDYETKKTTGAPAPAAPASLAPMPNLNNYCGTFS